RRADAPRPTQHQRALGKSYERVGGRLALHAVVRDGTPRTKLLNSRYLDRFGPKHGGGRTPAIDAAWPYGCDRNGCHRTGLSQNRMPFQRMRPIGSSPRPPAEACGRVSGGIWPQCRFGLSACRRFTRFHGITRAVRKTCAERLKRRKSHAAANLFSTERCLFF